MAQLVVGVAGAAIGGAIGGPMGAQIGWGLGAMIGGQLSKGENTRQQQLRAPKTQYGGKWPRIYGRVRTAGLVVWQSETEEVTTETTQGKGSSTVTSSSTTFYRSVLFGFAEYHFGAGIYPTGVSRIWKNGELIFSALADSTAATLDASAATAAFDEQQFFDGQEGQLPWDVYETAVGAENAQAWLYRATLGLKRINCGPTEQLPYFEFEVATSATATTPPAGHTLGLWSWFGPQTANGYYLPLPEGPAPQSNPEFLSPEGAAATRLPIWALVYSGFPGGTLDWYFSETGTQTPPSITYVGSPDVSLEVQYLYNGGGQKGSVAAQWTTDTQPSTLDPQTVDLADIVAQEHLRANGGVSSEFDVSALVGIEVIGFACAGTARDAIEQLMTAYYFEAVTTDKVYYVLRGGSSVATIPFDESGAGENQASMPFVGPARDNPAEVFRKGSLSYTNINADYDAGSVEGDRGVSTSNEIRQFQIALVTTPDKAQGIIDTITADAYFAAQTWKQCLTDQYARFHPTDVVTDTDEDGNTYRGRIVETMYSAGTYEHTKVLDDPSILVSVGIATDSYAPVIDLAPAVIPSATEMLLIDSPIFRDADNDAGFYALLKPETGTEWNTGGALLQSLDGTTFTQIGTVSSPATFGVTTSTLGDWTGGNVFDETDTVTVDVGDGTLSSYSRDAVLNGTAPYYFAGGEAFYARNATLVSAGVYTLSGLLRGRRGTGWATGTHTTGEDFALIGTAGTIRVPVSTSQIGASLQYKGVSIGASESTVTAESFTDNAVGLECFALVDLRVDVDTGVFTWRRRTRLATRWLGPLGSSTPLGEASESYTVELRDDTNALVDSDTVTTTTWTTAIPLLPDYTFTVYQNSATVNQGYPATLTI